MASSKVAPCASLHFAKITLHFPKMQGETGSIGAAFTGMQSVSVGDHRCSAKSLSDVSAHDRMPVILEPEQFEPWLIGAAGLD